MELQVAPQKAAGRLTGHQQEALGFGLHLGALAVLLVGAAVERLAGLVDDRLLQVHLAAQELQVQQTGSQGHRVSGWHQARNTSFFSK